MNIKDFIYVNSLDTGSTTYEDDLIDYFGLDKSKGYFDLRHELAEIMKAEPLETIEERFKIKGKWYGVESDLLGCSFEQYATLDLLLAQDDNVNNFHKLLAIYVRPLKKTFFKTKIKKFDSKEHDAIAEELLEMDINRALGLLIFFYQKGMESMTHIGISYLNRMKEETRES